MQKIWILSHARTGSGYLCEILNCSHKFSEIFTEWFIVPWTENEVYTYYPNKILEKLPANYKNNLPNYCKIHWSTINKMFRDIEELNILLSNVKFISLQREDLISQTTSQYIAIKTNKSRLKNETEKQEWLSKNFDINNHELLENYFQIANQNKMRATTQLDVKYEELLENPIKIVNEIFEYLDIQITNDEIEKSIKLANKKIIRQSHPRQEEIKNKLKSLLKIF